MRYQDRTIIQRICILAGSLLLVAACAILILWQWNIRTSQQQAQDYIQELQTLLPEPQNAVPEERRDNTMPVVSLDGTDLVGILEIPLFDSVLPVRADWGEPTKIPRRLSGSIYDGSLQIGATSQEGQYELYRSLSVGDSVFFTDMEGNRYALTITDLRYEKHADQAALQRREATLTLFIKNIYAFEYLIVFCDVPR